MKYSFVLLIWEAGAISRKDVAKLAGVSEATVSRVLNNVGPMKEETRERVLKAAAELDYVPSRLAQQFALKRSGNIGVILPFVPKVHLFSTYYFSEILSGIGEAAKGAGYDLLLIFQTPDDKKDYARLFRMQKVDACIILGSQDAGDEREALSELQKESFPFCLVNQRFEGERFLSVDADHVLGSRTAVSHLLSEGCRRIAFINGPAPYSNSADRFQGYLTALAEYSIAYESDLVFEGNYSRKSGYQLAESIGNRIRDGEADAVFAANDRMAIGVMQGLKEQGLEAGAHYKLIGYDDSDGSRIIHPRLSSVAVPFYEMGKLAAELVIDMQHKDNQEDDMPAQLRLLPVELIIRETS
ncbi:LacI family DNA-binding transcriptional regulator [Paenibacillus sp. HB172176]|uniref:LacI family DNA-binding transcriptional regulator n=1 Tax=Paenibacillus sp. HB172176 TaxID=2493690 RepID=UPI00143B0939|nr:LacI family DNA-binding transcriptional regulator [Paenibacillus sp. HB172176]